MTKYPVFLSQKHITEIQVKKISKNVVLYIKNMFWGVERITAFPLS